jgi:hypothetical protein
MRRLNYRPTPSIDELEVAVRRFCEMAWLDDGQALKGRHKYTADHRVQYRCLEANYILNLLEYGFGFHGSHRNITLALEV